MIKPLSPFFKYFGSKRNSAWKYPRPRYRTIIEPFAGGAGYSLNYWDRDVILYDADERVIAIWKYLIGATREDILAIPLLEVGESVDSLDIGDSERLLISCLVNTTPFRKVLTTWKSGAPYSGLWCEAKRRKIAEQVGQIKHWRAEVASYEQIENVESTWFVDPPYIKLANHYAASKERPIDFAHLGQWCQSLTGQVIVCEQEGADWLPFQYLGQASATRNNSKPGRKFKKCCEAIWTNEPLKQTSLFPITQSTTEQGTTMPKLLTADMVTIKHIKQIAKPFQSKMARIDKKIAALHEGREAEVRAMNDAVDAAVKDFVPEKSDSLIQAAGLRVDVVTASEPDGDE